MVYYVGFLEINFQKLFLNEIDRLVKDDGILVLGDFLPDSNTMRKYHHLQNEEVYTYKQDYSSCFIALGIYKELIKYCFDHENGKIFISNSYNRFSVTALVKSFKNFYHKYV